jgi:2-polyprenyl-6-methoxyphenol hydroxylase-like FAD-dependent oxidoreductase
MKLEYAGATQIGEISRLPNGLSHPVHEDYSLQMSSGEGVCCIYTPFDKDTIGWALSRVEPEREAKTGPFTPEEIAVLKREALKTGSMFNEPFRTIVDATDPATAFIRPAKEKHAFQHESRLRGVVFIGDANHVLSPCELVGANLALKDGWDLAEQMMQICRNSSLEAVVAAYDKLSVPREEHTIKHSHERIGTAHSTGFKWKVYKHGMAAQRALAKKRFEADVGFLSGFKFAVDGLFQSPYE